MKKFGRVFLLLAVCVMVLFTTACKKDDTPFAHGTIIGSSYSSRFLGIKINVPSNYEMMNDADLATMNSVKDMSADALKSKLDGGDFIYEMYTASNDGSSINITMQDQSASGTKMTEKDYFKHMKDLIVAQFQQAGYDITADESTVTFKGESTRCLKIALSDGNMTVHEVQIPIFRGNYVSCITFASQDESKLQSIIDMVSAN